MVKKLLFLLSMIFILNTNVFAAQPLILDDTNVISADAEKELNGILTDIKTSYDVPVVVYVTDEEVSNVRGRADDLLADHVGNDEDGLLLYINTYTRDYYFSLSGRVLKMIDDRRKESLDRRLLENLKSGNFDKVALDFVNESKSYIAGGEIAGNVIVEEQGLNEKDVATAGAGGIGTFLMSYFGLKKGSTPKPSGLIYSLTENTKAAFAQSEDAFITTRTTSRLIPRPTSSSSGSGGSRTTTHKGSGGGTFSGRGGKF